MPTTNSNNLKSVKHTDESNSLIIINLKNNWTIFLYLVSLLFLISATYCVSSALSKVYSVSITMESDHPDTVKLFFYKSLVNTKFKENKLVSKFISANKKTRLTFKVPAISMTRLRLDPGERPGVFRIYKISITQDLAREKIFDNNEIYNNFYCPNDSASMSLYREFVEFVSTNGYPQIIPKKSLSGMPFPALIFIPVIILTLFFYKTISKYSVEDFISFFFPHRNQPYSKTTVIQPLDGLRGFAALLVIAEHTWHPFLGAGRSGVMIFFSLSGFLLTRSFIDNPGRLFHAKNLTQYTQRRIERILPMYLFYLFLVYGLSYRFGDFLLHAFFIKGLGHLWTIPQEMTFYLFFPLILFIIHYLLRDKLLLTIPFLLTVILCWYRIVPTQKLYLYGMFYSKLPFMLPAFLSGAMFSLLYYKKLNKITPSIIVKNILLITSIMIIIMFCLFSNGQLLKSSEIYAFTYQTEYEISAALLLFIFLFTGKNYLTNLFSNFLLTSIGVVSYSMYLIHPLIIKIIDKAHLSGGSRFSVTVIVSYFFACFTYHLIETPFLRRKHNE